MPRFVITGLSKVLLTDVELVTNKGPCPEFAEYYHYPHDTDIDNQKTAEFDPYYDDSYSLGVILIGIITRMYGVSLKNIDEIYKKNNEKQIERLNSLKRSNEEDIRDQATESQERVESKLPEEIYIDAINEGFASFTNDSLDPKSNEALTKLLEVVRSLLTRQNLKTESLLMPLEEIAKLIENHKDYENTKTTLDLKKNQEWQEQLNKVLEYTKNARDGKLSNLYMLPDTARTEKLSQLYRNQNTANVGRLGRVLVKTSQPVLSDDNLKKFSADLKLTPNKPDSLSNTLALNRLSLVEDQPEGGNSLATDVNSKDLEILFSDKH